jgi:hypothetical protein
MQLGEKKHRANHTQLKCLNTESVPSNISYKSFKTYNLPMQNSYCDHRNFDSVNQSLATRISNIFTHNFRRILIIDYFNISLKFLVTTVLITNKIKIIT